VSGVDVDSEYQPYVQVVTTDLPDAEPRPADFVSVADFVQAYDAFHDRRRPTGAGTLDRAVRTASESMQGIDLQIRRVRGTEPEDDEWLFRVWMDFQFLIACLWRLRMAGRMAAAAADEVRAAVAVFDQEIPDLALMRHVSQHLEEYAVDGPKRRQKPPGSAEPVGRRRLEVGGPSADRFDWLGGTIVVDQARRAACSAVRRHQGQARLRA
jgi:hypothetical protein